MRTTTAVTATRSRRRLLVERAVCLALALLVVEAWIIQGLVVPRRVESGSMADALRGVHRDVVCGGCRFRFACGSESLPADGRAVCPNCGHAENRLAECPDISGDGLLVDKAVFHLRPPRRWELAAFRHPRQATLQCVKRVVGLPGESVQIRHGDLYIDGRLERKTLAQQRAMAVLVHDADFSRRAAGDESSRWRGQGWVSAKGRFAHAQSPRAASHGDIDWLVYHHAYHAPGDPGRLRPGPVSDRLGYNQDPAQRLSPPVPTADLLLSLRIVDTFGRGQLVLRASDGRREFRVSLDPSRKRFETASGDAVAGPPGRGTFRGRPLPDGTGPIPPWTKSLLVELSIIDRQMLLALDGRTVVCRPYERSGSDGGPPVEPLAIGARGLGVVLNELRVYRDVYYGRPAGVKGRWGLDEAVWLRAGQYFVLGDNSPVSEDSRTWPDSPVLPAELLLGRPVLVHLPLRGVTLWGRRFQVPDLGRIRYIR